MLQIMKIITNQVFVSNMNISSIVSAISKLFSTVRKPAPEVPTPLISLGGTMRPGLSTASSSAKIIVKLAERGIPTDPCPDGTQNLTNAMVAEIVNEIFRALREDAKIEISIAPGGAIVETNGANGGGPLVGIGGNINFVKGMGVIQ